MNIESDREAFELAPIKNEMSIERFAIQKGWNARRKTSLKSARTIEAMWKVS